MISVIMGAYNEEKRIRASVNSILTQTYNNFEFIIIDDCSKDSTFQILSDMAKNDNRLKIYKNQQNQGLAYCLNKAFEISKGEYIARHDADDISHADRFEKQLNFLQINRNISFVGTSANVVDSNGKWCKRAYPCNIGKFDIAKENPFIHPTIMFRRNALTAVNGYRNIKSTYRCEDYDLIIRLYAKGFKGVNLSDVLFDYYEEKDSSGRHTIRTRFNEFKTRVKGVKLLKTGFKGYIYALKPLILLLIPKKLYVKMHNKKWLK